MKRNMIALIAMVTALVATPAMAVDHVVHIYKHGYFPKVIYVQPGDNITFVNKTGFWARVTECDKRNSLSDWIYPGNSYTRSVAAIVADNSNKLGLNHPRFSRYNYDNNHDSWTYRGAQRSTLSFDPAPNGPGALTAPWSSSIC